MSTTINYERNDNFKHTTIPFTFEASITSDQKLFLNIKFF